MHPCPLRAGMGGGGAQQARVNITTGEEILPYVRQVAVAITGKV